MCRTGSALSSSLSGQRESKVCRGVYGSIDLHSGSREGGPVCASKTDILTFASPLSSLFSPEFKSPMILTNTEQGSELSLELMRRQALILVLLQAVLGLLEGTEASWLGQMAGCIINVNVPAGSLQDIRGLHLAHQVLLVKRLTACQLQGLMYQSKKTLAV